MNLPSLYELASELQIVRQQMLEGGMDEQTIADTIDNAITATMSRTVITHACTQMMVTSILFFGGEVLHNFALALTIGICFGIYSSVLVASPIAMWLGISREKFVKNAPTKEGRAA